MCSNGTKLALFAQSRSYVVSVSAVCSPFSLSFKKSPSASHLAEEMGVPAFFRFLSERYPNIMQDLIESKSIDPNIPIDASAPNPNGVEFDNLYIDMNGVIHPCSHPEDRPTPSTEEEMFRNVCYYVDRLFNAIRPRRLLFLAIDGVAPRAKMNQQRSRRFKAAKEARENYEAMEKVREEMLANGLELPPKPKKPWDSNIITPGTRFMSRLAEYLRFYVLERCNRYPAWRKVKVILSDASEPGEGEHKIMNFIRAQRTLQGYDPNQRHVIHGLDADLIMLALATHEVDFTILREQVLFGRAKREAAEKAQRAKQAGYDALKGIDPSQGLPHSDIISMKPLQLLRVPILREYLKIEFGALSFPGVLPFPFEFERIVDDFVFLCFFVGNDFLPHLPNLDIREGAIIFLFSAYKRLLPAIGAYLTNEGGEVNLRGVDVILSEVGKVEGELIRRRHVEELRTKTAVPQERNAPAEQKARLDSKRKREAASSAQDNNAAAERIRQLMAKKVKHEDVGTGSIEQNNAAAEQIRQHLVNTTPRVKVENEDNWDSYYKTKKDSYYLEKFGMEASVRGNIFKAYVEGLCWVMAYYYKGCASWSWYYPFHYAPFASDLTNIEQYGPVKFDLGEPFTPLAQLMGVLPPQSATALPDPLKALMCDDDSPIRDMYPDDVKTDPNGKTMPWLHVVLLPFIDERRLMEAMGEAPRDLDGEKTPGRGPLAQLTEEEQHRNTLGLGYIYLPDKSAQNTFGGNTFNLPTGGPLHVPQIGEGVTAPLEPEGVFLDIDRNEVLVMGYAMPAPAGPHQSVILPGAQEAAPTLRPQDQYLRTPRLSRGQSMEEVAQSMRAQQFGRAQQMGVQQMGGPAAMYGVVGARPPPPPPPRLAAGIRPPPPPPPRRPQSAAPSSVVPVVPSRSVLLARLREALSNQNRY